MPLWYRTITFRALPPAAVSRAARSRVAADVAPAEVRAEIPAESARWVTLLAAVRAEEPRTPSVAAAEAAEEQQVPSAAERLPQAAEAA